MQRRPGLPRLVADTGDEGSRRTGRCQRNRSPVAGEQMPFRHEAVDRDLQPLGRGVHVPRGAAGGRLLAQHVPRLDRAAKLELDAADLGDPDAREAELQVRREPGKIEVDAVGTQVGDDLGDVGQREVRQQESLVQGCPSGPAAPSTAPRRTERSMLGPAGPGPAPCPGAAASRSRAARAAQAGRAASRGCRACRCRTRRDGCCR